MDLGAEVAHDAAGVAERFGESGLLGLEVGASTGSIKLDKISNNYRAIFAIFWRSRSRLCRSRCLQVNMPLAAFLKRYKIFSL